MTKKLSLVFYKGGTRVIIGEAEIEPNGTFSAHIHEIMFSGNIGVSASFGFVVVEELDESEQSSLHRKIDPPDKTRF